MGSATQVLVTEHQAIRRMLGVLDRLCERAAAGGPDGHAQRAGQILEFLQGFADRCHHGKEEQHLFPALVRQGMSSESGPVAVMLAEHRQGRDLIAAMASAQAAWADGDQAAGARFSAAATAYQSLLDAHIEKENNVLFVMADRLLDPAAQDTLVEQFERFEEQVMGAGRHAALHAMMDTLLAGYPPPQEKPGSAQ
jgi:hemerythrin-like domain-containing protein